jgi:hypothetical protein
MLTELSKTLDKRRMELVDLLENHSGEIEVEKQHQIYGAINEIDIFMQTLQYYKAKELHEVQDDIKLVGPQKTDSVFKRLFDGIAQVFKNR